MLNELFVTNLASTTVESGGMTAPESGTIETLTVSEANGIFPVVHRGVAQFHFKDRSPNHAGEIFRCIETDNERWTVIRGAEGSTPLPHYRRFTIRQVVTAEFLQRLGGGSTTELVNVVTVHDADNTGATPSDSAINAALRSGPTYLPSGVYRIDKPLNFLPGDVMLSFGNAIIRPSHGFFGDSAIELVDGSAITRIEHVTLDGSLLGAGNSVYGIFAETRTLEAELRNIRISGFPNSGIIASGVGWMLDRISCLHNFGSGFEFDLYDSLQLCCRAIGNSSYGFVGAWSGERIGCVARNNGSGDYRIADNPVRRLSFFGSGSAA